MRKYTRKNNINKPKSLTKKDYEQILSYYKIKVPLKIHEIKEEAEKILSSKLCRCIKKVNANANGIMNEAKSIGICTKTIFNRKGLTRGKFNCKGKQNVTYKKNKNIL